MNETELLQKWSIAALVLAATLIGVGLIRWGLKRIAAHDKFSWIAQLAPSASNLLFVVGLMGFADLAPLSPVVAHWFENGVYVLGVILVLALGSRAAMLAIEWSSLKTQHSRTLHQGFIPLMRNLVTLFVFFTGAIMVLKRFNYDVMSLLTALGVGSLAVGLAAKDTLSNMISGFTLIIDRNLHPGDRINLGGSVGDVEEIGLRSTRIRIGSGNLLIVPNSELVNTKIINYSMPSRATACTAQFRLPYSAPFEKVREIGLSVLDGMDKIDRNRPRSLQVSNLAEGFQLVTASFWVRDLSDEAPSVAAFNEKLLERARQQGIPLS